MARPEYHDIETRKRLFRNTVIDPDNGIRDHAILRFMYGAPVRPVELIRFKTHDLVNDNGILKSGDNGIIRAEVSFNGRERPLPINDPDLISALQKWIDFRLTHGWGLTKTGFIDLDQSFFLMSKNKGFTLSTSVIDDVKKHNSESINRVIRKRYALNGVTGSVESALRTWTLERHRECRALRYIWLLRGDNDIASVRRVIGKYPVRLGALVEKVY
jgi:integrase